MEFITTYLGLCVLFRGTKDFSMIKSVDNILCGVVCESFVRVYL